MAEFWLSWYNVEDLGTFELHSPWWVSGYREVETPEGDIIDHETIVAAVRAVDEDAAWAMVAEAYDNPPDSLEQRFIHPLSGSPFSDRFPQATWMEWSAEATCCCPDMHALS